MTLKTFTFADVRGQQKANRAMEIAAAGGHHLALVGPRGCGKSALVAAYSRHVALEWDGRPGHPAPRILAPAPRSSPSDLAGIGSNEADLIGRMEGGLLVLDDIDRFQSETLAAVRACIDAGVARPCDETRGPPIFQLVATLSVCCCGYGYIGFSPCGEGRACLIRHQGQALRWLLDVLDLQVELENTHPCDWLGERGGEELSKAHIARARLEQERRGVRNVDLDGEQLTQVCRLAKDAQALFDRAMHCQEMTGRDCAAALRVARTLADMETSPTINRVHVAEAMIYRLPRPLFAQYVHHMQDRAI